MNEKYENSGFSTTQSLVSIRPKIVNSPDDRFKSLLFLPENADRTHEGGLRTKGYFKKTSDGKPLVSVITAVFNGKNYLEETILSVLGQTYDNVEYIIVDGGSTDGTLDIIKNYDGSIDYWVSEKDDGVYDAMNKGLCLASGEFVSILNSDDHYHKDAVARSIDNILQTKSDYSMAQVYNIENRHCERPIFPMTPGKVYQEMPYPHITAFIKLSVYKRIGLFDTQFAISADHDLAVRIHLKGFRACCLPEVIAHKHHGGISCSARRFKESTAVVIKNGKSPLVAKIEFLVWLARYATAKLLPERVVRALMRMGNSRRA